MLVSALLRSAQKSLLCSVEIWLLRTVVLVEPGVAVGVVVPVAEFAGWVEEIELELGVSAARFEDSANVAEFHPDGGTEEYGGRYERSSEAPASFRAWVCQRVSQMGL